MRRFLLRKRVLIPLAGGAVLLLAGYFIALPWVVRGRVKAVLHQLELGDATFRVTRATPWGSTIRDIDAGDGNRIDELRVTYSAGGLWNRRIDRVHISGLRVVAEVREGAVAIPALDALRRAPAAVRRATSNAPVATAPAATAPVAPPTAWPFLSIALADSHFIVRTPQREVDVALEGHLVGRQLRLKLSPPGAAVSVTGVLGDERGAQEMALDFAGVSGRDLSAILSGIAPKVPVRIASKVDGKGAVRRWGGATTFSLDLTATPADEPAAPSAKQLAGTNVRIEEGVLHIEGTLARDGSSLRVTTGGLTLAENAVGATASGIKGDVSLASLSPAATAQDQVVRVERLSAAKLDLTDGFARFDVSPGGLINVDETRWRFLGGELSAADVRIVPGEPVALTLVAKDLQLRDLLGLLAQGKATGNGKVNVRLPMVISPDGAVTLGEGSAEAVAGGTLSVTDADTLAAVAGDAVKQAKGNVTSQAEAQVRRDVVAAMKDFEFESLTARLKNEPGQGLVAYVRMKGHGRTGAKQALDYDLRVTGLGELLQSLVGLQRTMTQQREAATP